MDSIKIKMNKLEALSSNKVFRLRKQVGRKYHKVVITDEANLSLVFHMYKSMTVLVLDNMSSSEMTAQVEKLMEELSVIQKHQKIIFIYACGYCSLLERHSSARKSTEACCKDCHIYVLKKTLQNISKQMLLVKKIVMAKIPKCYFLPVALPPFSFDWHFSFVKGSHQSCCPHLVEELACFTPSVLTQMQKVLDSVVNNYNINVNVFCVKGKLPLIEWSNIYLVENQIFTRQGIIAKKINSLICDFIHTIYQEECHQELDHVQMALDEDIEVKEEPAEKGDVDEVNSLQLDSTSQSVGVAQVCDFRDASKNSEIRSPVTSSELDVDSEMVMSSQGKRKSKVYQVCPSQSKKKRTKQSLLPSLNIPLAAVGSSSEAEYDLPDETVNLESPSDVSSVGTTSVITSISKHDSGSHSTYVNREQNKCVTGVRASNLSLPRGENDCSVLSPDLEVLEDEIQVLGRRRIRKKKNIQIIDVGGRSSSDIQVLCPVECQNVQVPNLESEPTKKRGSSSKPKAKSKNNVNPYDGNEELVVLDDHCNENEMEKMKNLGTLVSCNAPADDVAACDSSDYVSCDENSDVFCERVSKLGRKKRLVSSPEVEWVLPLQKEVSSTGGQSFEPCVGVEKLGSCVSSSVLETLSSEGLDAPSTSLQKPGNELLSVPSKSVSPKQQLRKKNLTHHASGLGIFGNKSKCKVFVSEDDSLMDTIKKESESEDTDAPDCDVSIFRQTVEAGSALRVLVTDDRFVELSDVLDEEAYNNYLHISCRGGLIRRFFTPVLAAIKESMRIKMNQKKRLLVAVCLGTADIVTFLNDSTSQASGVYSNRPATIALKVAEDLNVFKKAILKEYPSACVLFFKLPKVSKEGNLKIAIDKVNSSIHFLNHQDTQLSFCLAQECPIVPKLSMPQYVLSKNFVTSWFQVCKWYLEVLGHSLEKPSNVSNFDKSLRNKRCVSRDAISSPHVKVVKKPSRLSYVNEHSNIVCHIPKLGPSVEPGATSLMKSSTSDGPDVACIDESESDITIVYTDSDSDAESSITYRHVRAQVAQLESVLRNTTFENRDLSFDINNSLLSSNVCALIAVGRTNGEQVDEKGLLRIACKFKEAEKKNDSAPPSLDAKEKKLIIIAVGKTMEYLEEATLSQAANDLLYTSVFSLKKVYTG